MVRIVDTLLARHYAKASDIHIEPYEKEVVIRYRLDGVLHDAMILPKMWRRGLRRIKILANLRLDEKRLPQDGRFKMSQVVRAWRFGFPFCPLIMAKKS